MSWLQVECPHCSGVMNVPSSAAEHPVMCFGCRRPYVVPTAATMALDPRSPLPPLEILSPPTRQGNRPEGISPLRALPQTAREADAASPAIALETPAAVAAEFHRAAAATFAEVVRPEPVAAGNDGLRRSQLPPPASVRGLSPAGDVEPAPAAEAGENAFQATRRRLRLADVKYYYNLAVIVLGLALMLALAYFFLHREPPP